MSKKIVKHKTANFTLEPDGFSIHTFELSKKLSATEYYDIKDIFYIVIFCGTQLFGQFKRVDRESIWLQGEVCGFMFDDLFTHAL